MQITIFIDIETNGLSPLVHRVVCAAWAEGTGGIQHVWAKDEADLLRELLTRLPSDGVLVGYNLPFDVGFLVMRCLKHGVDPTKLLALGRVDLMEPVRQMVGSWVSLEKVAKFFGLKKRTNGQGVPELWEAGEVGVIAEYCAEDVELVRAIHAKLKPLLEERATQAQRDYMRSLKIPFDGKTTKDEASALLDARVNKRR